MKIVDHGDRTISGQLLAARHKDPNCINTRVNYRRGDVWCAHCEECYRNENKASHTYRNRIGQLSCNTCGRPVRTHRKSINPIS